LDPQCRFGLNNINLIKKAVAPIPSGNNGEDSDSPPTGTKRIPKGEDFWGKVDTYFAEMITKFGRDLAGPHWRE